MSIFTTASAVCPTCGTTCTLEYPSSINADRRPDLRAAILDHSLFTLPCRGCGEILTFEPHITYLDMVRGQWILAGSVDEVENWRAAESAAVQVHRRTFGPDAPAAARALGAALTPRLVFGWPALIEKLLCQELGLDDTSLEALKLAIVRDGPLRDLDATQELRVRGRTGDSLDFAWADPVSGAVSARFSVPESAYAVVKGGDDWAALRQRLAGPMYVDMNRVLRDAAPDAAG